MNKFFTKKRIVTGSCIGIFLAAISYLFLGVFYESNFRSMQDTIWSFQDIDLTGLRELQASGGTAVRFPDLQRRLKHVKGPKIIVDGMAEYHGYVDGLIDGIPTTFLAYHHAKPDLRYLIRRLVFTGTTEVRPERVVSEAEIVKRYKFEGYKKVNIGSAFVETEANIDEIVEFFTNLLEGTWLHFHCVHGKGRTSILLVMLDILKNAPKVALKDIVKRQYLLGSEDLFDTVVWKNGTYDQEMLTRRKKFIEEFYEFACQRKAGGIPRWSEWHQQQKEKYKIDS